MSTNTPSTMNDWDNWSYITSVEINSSSYGHGQPTFGHEQTVAVESEIGGCRIATEVPERFDKDNIVHAYKEILSFLEARNVFDINTDDEINFHSPRGRTVDSYYYSTGNDKGIQDISFKGEGVTEDEIRRQTDNMIEKMKEDNLL